VDGVPAVIITSTFSRTNSAASRELATAVLLGWVLIRRQADHPAPVLPIDLFRKPLFALSTVTAICSFAAQGLAFVSLPFYFEDILGPRRSRPAFS
jgi:MFS transporter, DHA2 family, multidrug resistance protein